MKYSFALFDLDGTLTDPAEGITNAVKYALGKFGIQVADNRELYKFIGPPLKASFSEYYGFSEEKAGVALKYYREYFSEKGIFENVKYPGIDGVLEALSGAGTVISLATSKPDLFSERILEKFGLRKYFSFIAANTMDELRPAKEDVVAYAIKELGIKDTSSAVMIGDRKYDVIGGKAFGMKTVGVAYGYGGRKELEDAGADFIADSVDDLYGILI